MQGEDDTPKGPARLTAPVDIASLAAFRALFGGVLALAAVRCIVKGWVHTQYIQPRFHFAYPHLDFVQPWPGPGMYLHFAALVLAALGLALGAHTRLCAFVVALGFSYVELLDRATYLNHYYLVCLIAWLLVLLPAGSALSVDALRDPERRVASIPRWTLLALRLQVGVVYVFAGVAKLNADWLLHAEPLRIWLAARSDIPVLGVWLAQPSVAVAASWLGAVFDLSIVGLLLWRRTRAFGFVAAAIFHGLTGLLFPIGMFPWIMLACATLFFEPDWPRRLLSRRVPHGREVPRGPTALSRPSVVTLVALHCAVQVFVPLRSALVRDSAWTRQGFDFAWKVMVAEKAGYVRFSARDRRDGRAVPIAIDQYLSATQERAMAQDPALIRDLARHIARDLRARAGVDVAVFADAFATLNGRPAQRQIAPDVDLTREPLPAHWIVPLSRRPSM